MIPLRATGMLNVSTQKALMFVAVMRDTQEMERTAKVEKHMSTFQVEILQSGLHNRTQLNSPFAYLLQLLS